MGQVIGDGIARLIKENTSGLPEVTDIPDMPQVKEPKAESWTPAMYNNPKGTTVISDELFGELTTQSKRYKWFMEQAVDCFASYLEIDLSRFDDSLDGRKAFFAFIDKEIEGIL